MQEEKKYHNDDLNSSITSSEFFKPKKILIDHENKSGKSSTASTASLNNHPSPRQDSFQNFSSLSTSLSKSSLSGKLPRKVPSSNVLLKPSSTPAFISPTRALLDYFECLTEYEHNEISLYDEIYFIGENCTKLRGKYDDDEGYYKAVVGDHLGFRYQVKELLGCGTFGHVF